MNSSPCCGGGAPIITSFEPGEDWFFDYEKRRPAGRVPANWESLLN